MKKNLFILLAGIFILISCNENEITLKQPDVKLWYTQPATNWLEAIPVGNGRLGAMVFGGTYRERIQLNEESIWAGQPLNNNNPEALKHLDKLQQLLISGKVEEAYKLVGKYYIGTPPRVRSYQPAGDIIIISDSTGPITGFKRELILETGIARTTYKIGNTKYIREVFASAPDNIIVIHVKAEGPGKIDSEIFLSREKDATVSVQGNNQLVMKGQIMDAPDPQSGPGGKHMRFAEILKVKNPKGTVSAGDTSLTIRDAKELTLCFTAITDYDSKTLGFNRNINTENECRKILEQVEGKTYEKIRSDHIRNHAALFNRVSLKLPETEISLLSTDQRLEAIKQGKSDPAFAALYFQYGRYLLMGSSRSPGVLPANLQGVWNDKFKAPWNADFHTNINLQMNYWPAEIGNLPECVTPLSHFMHQLRAPGARTASEMYGARGWTFHHLTDPFGRTGVMDGPWGATPMDGPWMTFPLWRHYEYTLDTTYLKETAYPLMKGAAQFVMDFLIEDKEGHLVTAPSSSPENAYYIPGTDRKSVLTYASTMDIEIITALFHNTIKATEILQRDQELKDSLTSILKQLPPLKIGKDSTLQEWIKDYREVQPGHRHISHLLALYPLNQISPDKPELYEAARKTIERRLSHGGGHTGWSRAWIVNFYDRLHMPEEAHKHLMLLFRKSTLSNLFDTHPPFQIDGNFGGAAGIAGMLLQSQENQIRILPALPAEWDHGQVKGLKARGNFTMDITWENHQLKELRIESFGNLPCKIIYGDHEVSFDAKENELYVFNENLKLINKN